MASMSLADSPSKGPTTGVALPMKPSRRREKIQMSCTRCRARKVKCDRKYPCQNCAQRGHGETCTFLRPSHRAAQYQSSEMTNIRERVVQLEGLLRSLGGPKEANSPEWPLDIVNSKNFSSNEEMNAAQTMSDSSSEPPGRISEEKAEKKYFGSSHWYAILDEVVELRELLDDDNLPEENNGGVLLENRRPSLLLSIDCSITKEEILASIPPKDVIDRLLSRFFSSFDMINVIVHIPTFQKKYGEFWIDSSSVPIMWLSILFSMMSVAEYFFLLAGDEPPGPPHNPQYMIQEYREKAAQCLILGDYTRSNEYTIEALLSYNTAEQIPSNATKAGGNMLNGIMVRSAMRMGYHRDPSHFPKISVLHAEMRRRIWSTIFIGDIVTSSQEGLPRLINESQVDTQLPRNLLDEDFDEDTAELPPSRPDTEGTVILYAIAKHKLTAVLGLIADQATSTQPVSYVDDVMNLDKQLHEVYGSTPPSLLMRSMAGSFIDSPTLIARRFAIDLLFQKALCTLHRKYLIRARFDTGYEYSQRSCLNAAMQILAHQSVIHDECQPGGLLHRDRWKLRPHFGQDFLLATMIIGLEFYYLKRRSSMENSPSMTPNKIYDEETMLKALQTSYNIWKESAASSKEALRATTGLELILGKAMPRTSNEALDRSVEHDAYSSSLSSTYVGKTSTNASPGVITDFQTDIGISYHQGSFESLNVESYPFSDDYFFDETSIQQFDGIQVLQGNLMPFSNAGNVESNTQEPAKFDWMNS